METQQFNEPRTQSSSALHRHAVVLGIRLQLRPQNGKREHSTSSRRQAKKWCMTGLPGFKVFPLSLECTQMWLVLPPIHD